VTNFDFLLPEWPEVHEDAVKAESATLADPRTACFYARRALEAMVKWVYKADRSLHLPYQDNLSALLHEPSFKQTATEAVFNKAKLINSIGNRAVHELRPVPASASDIAIRELFHVGYWLAHTYARGPKPSPSLVFDASLIPSSSEVPAQTAARLQKLEAGLHERDEKLTELLSGRDALDAELVRLRAEVAAAKKANEQCADDHDYSESQTRDYFIDMLLHEAGWLLDHEHDREFPVTGMPNATGEGFVDYVLWADDGRPLAVVEAKRTKKDAKIGQRQAELYANCLEAQFDQRPVIFYTNGYDHWLWDDGNYPPRAVQGFFTKSQLELMIQRRQSRKSLTSAQINSSIVERYYQTRAIRRIAETFETDRERKALLVMATGAGKTRTVIALVDLLMRCNWAKRILFLSDRVALVNQAVGAFKAHLLDASPVNLITDKTGDGRVFVSTYPSMMGLIDELKDGQRRFGPGHFDLIVIDEAHRSVYQKYRAIFDYFDSLLIGLTATPKDEIDINTYSLFDLERGVPTDAYSLEDAIKDEFLVPPHSRTVPIKFPRQGIRYADLSEEEKELWDATEWGEDGTESAPDAVAASALNSWLFNEDTVDKALAHLMTRGQMVAGGDRLGKTIIFAKNQAHAQFIVQRFDANYPSLKGRFARAIYHGLPYAQSLIDDFSNRDKAPHVAVSVDMLDTGIDVPEVVNLVFLKQVRSKTKFWQMVGRGTRVCPDLFSPGQDKTGFDILDYCENLEFFSQDVTTSESRLVDSLGKRLFTTRLELIAELDRTTEAERAPDDDDVALRKDMANVLYTEVSCMNLDNFIVRPQRKLVEKFSEPESWTALSPDDIKGLATNVAGLPSEIDPEDEEAKRFDLLMLRLQLAVLRHEPGFDRLSARVRTIAGLLEEQSSIPMIMHQLVLLEEIQSDDWWQDVTPAMLEDARKRLRLLVRLIEKQKRKIIYSDYEDEVGEEAEIDLLGYTPGANFEQFRIKARAFLRAHDDHIAIHRLRTNKALTAADLAELELMLANNGIGDAAAVQKAAEDSQGLGLFVRSLVGLDRGAAKEAFAEFLAGKTLGANQIHFVDMIINHLTEHGVMSTALLYESPFTDLSPHGPDGLFTLDELDALVAVLDHVRAAAIAA
jgi:type I restriction enzyme R subunit